MGDNDEDEKGGVQEYFLCLMSLIHRCGSASIDRSHRHRARVHLLCPDEEAEGLAKQHKGIMERALIQTSPLTVTQYDCSDTFWPQLGLLPYGVTVSGEVCIGNVPFTRIECHCSSVNRYAQYGYSDASYSDNSVTAVTGFCFLVPERIFLL